MGKADGCGVLWEGLVVREDPVGEAVIFEGVDSDGDGDNVLVVVLVLVGCVFIGCVPGVILLLVVAEAVLSLPRLAAFVVDASADAKRSRVPVSPAARQRPRADGSDQDGSISGGPVSGGSGAGRDGTGHDGTGRVAAIASRLALDLRAVRDGGAAQSADHHGL